MSPIKPAHVFTLVSLFLIGWIYMEVHRLNSDKNFQREVTEFMLKGGRFTIEDGRRLEERICRLEPDCEK